MDRETLVQLSEEEKIERILVLQASVAVLEARLREVEDRLNRPPKTPQNSSLPAARHPKANKPKAPGKKCGPKFGHGGKSRTRDEPDVQLDCRVDRCASCGADLRHTPQHPVGRSQVIELPPIQPMVIEAVIYEVCCPHCAGCQRAVYPAGLEAQRTFGPNVETLVCYLRQVHHLSYARLQAVLATVFGLALSQGALDNILRRVVRHLQPIAQQIKQAVQNSGVIGSDETGARIAGRNAWEWVFQTPTASYHTLQPTRSSTVIDTFMQDKRADVWVADLAPAQIKGGQAHAQQFAMCGAHQLRDLQYALDCGDTQFAPAFRGLLLEAKILSDCRAQMTPTLYQELTQCVQATCEALLLLQPAHEAGCKLQRRYRRHRQALFVFLDHTDVPFDNNASERALRNSVIHRKVTGGFRSDWGAEAYAIITTIVQTARKNNLCLFETLRSLLIPSPLPLLQLRE